MTLKTEKENETTDTEMMQDSNENPSCEARIGAALESRLADLWAFAEGPYDEDDNPTGYDAEEVGEPFEYGLSIDFVEPDTFGTEGHDGYIRYQLSWGGPADEFRIDAHGRVTYIFQDWWDHAERRVYGADAERVLDHLMLNEYPSITQSAHILIKDVPAEVWMWMSEVNDEEE
jgi:hypothetical protein